MLLQYLKNKRNYCLKVVFTWGLYATPLARNFRESMDNEESHNPKNGLEKFLYFIVYFLIFTIPWAIIAYVIHSFRLIYYQISIWHYNRKEKKKRVYDTAISRDESNLQEYGQFICK